MSRYIPGQIVRRIDSIGRSYYVPREGGQRVPRSTWVEERQAIRRVQKEVEEAARRGEAPVPPPTGSPGEAAFPPGVSDVGVPEREVWTDEHGVEWEVPEPVEGTGETP